MAFVVAIARNPPYLCFYWKSERGGRGGVEKGVITPCQNVTERIERHFKRVFFVG